MTNEDKHAQAFGEYFSELISSSAYQSQAEVAQVLHVSLRSVNKYANGHVTPSVQMCEAIAFAFGVSIAEVRAAAGKPAPTSIDGVFDRQIRSLMLGMDWTPERLIRLREFLEEMDNEEAKRTSTITLGQAPSSERGR